MSFEPRLHKNKLIFDFMIKNNYHKADTIYEILSFLKLKKKKSSWQGSIDSPKSFMVLMVGLQITPLSPTIYHLFIKSKFNLKILQL